jgi:outer membrane immunogenic protein
MYVTGGLAIAHINSSQALQFLNGINPPSYDGFDSRTRIGFTVGGGHEYAFTNNLSVKVEYLYLYFGTYTFASPFSVDPAIAGGGAGRAPLRSGVDSRDRRFNNCMFPVWG